MIASSLFADIRIEDMASATGLPEGSPANWP
jgi:hypothetical protein